MKSPVLAERLSLRRFDLPGWIATVAKVAAIGVALAVTPWLPILGRLEYFLKVDRYPQATIFLAINAICVAGFVIGPFLRSPFARVPVVALCISGFAADQLAIAISGRYLDETLTTTLWREKAMIATASSAYFWPMLQVLSWVLPIAVVMALKPARPVSLSARWAIVPAAALAGCVVIAKITMNGTTEFPATFRVPAIAAVTVLYDTYSGPREELEQLPVPRSRYSKIVMIVDESIRGDFVGINSASQNTTPFLAGLQHGLTNFGLASSAHNCSAPARLILRSGLRAADLPDLEEKAFKAPIIWQFARNAGYRTILIDAFAEVFGTHSFMTKPERAFIDRSIAVSGSPIYMRDQKIADDILPSLLASKEPTFIYVNKYGSHFPYRQTYPSNFPPGSPETNDNLNNRAELVASYRRAVQWSVDEFFRVLLGRIDLADTLIVYTSDHGQSMLDGGYKLTHCSTGSTVHPGEAIVPLFTISSDSAFSRALAATARMHFGTTTHFQIFPTLLLAMGYEEAWVASHYGRDSLVRMSEQGRRRFLTGNMFGTGLGAKWIDVDKANNAVR